MVAFEGSGSSSSAAAIIGCWFGWYVYTKYARVTKHALYVGLKDPVAVIGC